MNKTFYGGTETTHGLARYFPYHGIDCPVKVHLLRKRNGTVLVPQTRIGRYVHALPGGGFVLGEPVELIKVEV